MRLLSRLEYIYLCGKRKLAMRAFVRNSLATFETEVSKLIKDIPPSARVGIFGTFDSARLIHLFLKQKKFNKLYFIKTNPKIKKIKGSLVVDTPQLTDLNLEAVIISSLSRSNDLRDVIQKTGYQGKILSFPNLSHLSTSLLSDQANYKKISRLHSKHQNVPAFVIGNGPSLQLTSPCLINKNAITLAANGIIRQQDFHPDYFFALDQSALTMWASEICALPSTLMFPAHLKRAVKKLLPGSRTKEKLFFPVCYEHQGGMDVENWHLKGFEAGQTVACTMLQFAFLMGCSPIYIIGVDLSYSPENVNYFSASYHSQETPQYDRRVTDFCNAKMYHSIKRTADSCQQAGVPVYNCSPQSNLDFLEKIPFETALKQLQALD